MVLAKSNRRSLVTGALILVAIIVMPLAAEQVSDPSVPIKNLQFQSADIRSVLTHLADYGGVNVIIAPDVTGTVTVKLTNVMWRQAMDIIGRTYDLAIVDEQAGYVRILPVDNYRKELTQQEKHRTDQLKLVQLETRIVKISNSTSNDIVNAVKSLLTERGTVTSDSRSNSIIIQEVPDNMSDVLEYIAELDKPSKQIKISAQLLEIFTNDFMELGIDWNVDGSYMTESGRKIEQTGSVTTNDVGRAAASYNIIALQHGYNVEALVEAIVSTGKGKIIAHPEITTLDNKEAKIQMGSKVPVKQFDEAGNVVIKFEEVGTILKVTPHITAENQVLMHLSPERSTYQFDPNGIIINTSNAETNVIVSNGQTAVIGGLTTEDEVEGELGVPL
ncbi:MAG: secretin N-terminal domain-containing protein, partial [candidate division Zixibacteria bacterium]|nr:secretin N-terminal domain-containing protein [candidate division Zixibacteria bacterium]